MKHNEKHFHTKSKQNYEESYKLSRYQTVVGDYAEIGGYRCEFVAVGAGSASTAISEVLAGRVVTTYLFNCRGWLDTLLLLPTLKTRLPNIVVTHSSSADYAFQSLASAFTRRQP